MSNIRDRTKYSPLWETWCDSCGKGVSPDHAGNCAWCAAPTRRNHHANRDHPNRYPGIPTPLFDAARKAQDAGIPVAEFARSALHLTKRRDAQSLAQSIRSEFFRRGWTVFDAATGGRHAKTRYKKRLAYGERPEGLCVSTNRTGKPCKRWATPGNTHCNLHDPARREQMQAAYTQNLRDVAKELADTRARWSELAPLLRAWTDQYGYGARTAALRRTGVTLNVYQGMLDFERRGIDRPITAEYERRIRELLQTPPERLESDGLKRGKTVAA